jgi:hypothetical protein
LPEPIFPIRRIDDWSMTGKSKFSRHRKLFM